MTSGQPILSVTNSMIPNCRPWGGRYESCYAYITCTEARNKIKSFVIQTVYNDVLVTFDNKPLADIWVALYYPSFMPCLAASLHLHLEVKERVQNGKPGKHEQSLEHLGFWQLTDSSIWISTPNIFRVLSDWYTVVIVYTYGKTCPSLLLIVLERSCLV